jgi:hypothetical protein
MAKLGFDVRLPHAMQDVFDEASRQKHRDHTESHCTDRDRGTTDVAKNASQRQKERYSALHGMCGKLPVAHNDTLRAPTGIAEADPRG